MERLKTCLLKKPSKNDLDDGLETATEYTERWTSVRIIYYTMFLMSLGFSIILTGVWPYLDKLDPHAGKEFLGWIVGANPVGQMIFSPLVGWWGNRLGSIRLPLLCSLALFSIASGIYACLELFPTHQKYWMLYSRFLIGVSSSSVAVCRSYLSAATKIKERTGAVSMVSLAQTLGFIVGPVLQGAVTMFGEDGLPLVKNKLHLNMYTATGWINVFMGILNFCLFLPYVFKEKRIAAREAMMQQGLLSEKETWKSMKPDYLSAWTLICAFFILVFNFVFLETYVNGICRLATPLTMDMFAWTKAEALYYMAWIMAVGAILASAMFLMIDPLCKRFPEQQVLIWGGFFLMVLGRAVYIPMSDTPPKIALAENDTLTSMRLEDASQQRLVPIPYDMDPTVEKPFLSVVFAAPPAGQLIFSPLIGWCSNRLSSIRVPFVLLTALFVFGNALYSVVELFPTPYRNRAYISTATKLSERTGAISMSSLAQTFGLAIGPIIQAALSAIGKEGLMWFGLRINMYTMAGWICAACGVVYIMFLNPSCFVHRTIAAQEAMKTIGSNKATDTYEPLRMFSIWTIMIGYSVLMFFYVSFQTALSPISLDQFGWSHEESLYYLVK
uniref:Major facilitator superfamily (MFS) profile domain-containing protein n=1 Tax=Anopheles epiroticus TaxID=199890 RepID=A0A182PKB7_9DIPT